MIGGKLSSYASGLSYASGVAAQFPDDPLLAEMDIEAYVGTPLRNSRGELTGILVVLFRRELATPAIIEDLFELSSPRVASELDRRQAEREYERLLQDMGERVKELRGLYGVAQALAESSTPEELFQRACAVMPGAWHYPEFTCVRVVIDAREYVSESFAPTRWKQAADILVSGEVRGTIEVYYLREYPELDEGPFVTEERKLINGLANILGAAVAREDAVADLRTSEEKYRTLFESSMDAVMTLAPPAWKLTAGNPAMIQMFGAADEEDFVSGPPWELSPEFQPDGRPSVDKAREMIETAMREGAHSFEWLHRRRSGESFPAIVVLRRLEFSGTSALQATVRDISKIIQEDKEKAELEQQYRQAQKMQAVGLLAGGVAHDFNNLLTVINSYAGFALGDLHEGDPMRADMQAILDAGERAATLTRQLLAFSRKQVMESRVVDLNEIVGNLEKMLKRMLGEDVELSSLLSEKMAHVNADPGQLDQVLMNLAVNARDAMPKGGKLTIETANVSIDELNAGKHRDTPIGQYVMLSVTDTGVGIPDDVKERIFEPFYTTKEKGQGTGLGLSTVYGIVKQSGGTIDVDSEPGEGTTVKIYLPRSEPVEEEARRVSAITPRRATETVLVVEDEDAVRRVAERILTSAGYNVITAANSGEALLECERHEGEIQLLVTDVVMPKMSGKELADRLRKVTPGLKVLYMSGYTDDTIIQHGVLTRGTHFISKPFKSPDLIKKVGKALDSG